tara:strand:- start:22013 stop:22201 length:189 start_codon:yes stop_codon:yes gene_type:complete
MGNNAIKKAAAKKHNDAVAARKEAIEAERIDRKDNPERYRRGRTSKLSMQRLAAYSAMGILY